MAHFSQKYQLLSSNLSSVFHPTSPIKGLGFLEEPNKNHINAAPFSQFYQPEPFDDFPDNNVCVHESGTCPPQGTKAITNGTSVCTKISCPNSLVNSNKVEPTIVKQVSHLVHSPIDNKKRKNKEGSSSTSSQSTMNMEETQAQKQKKATEETPTGYIHVRARRGQATDSHSLAERVRREKISERMKILQALVPGCDKVNGKALMLDEIINYVQSLQHQVEFLSMKLATVNPMYDDFGLDIDTILMATTDEQRPTALGSPQPLRPPPPPTCIQPSHAAQQIPIHQEFLPNISPRGSGQHLWDFDDQIIHKIVNQQLSEFNSY